MHSPTKTRAWRLALIAAPLVLALSACGGSSDDDPSGKPSSSGKASASASAPADPSASAGASDPSAAGSTDPSAAPAQPSVDSNATVDGSPDVAKTITDGGTVSCIGVDLTLSASDTAITLDGDCGQVILDGSNTTITATTATSVIINGSNVTFNGELIGWLTIAGSNNTATLSDGIFQELIMTGSNNTVSYKDTVPTITDSGSSNTHP